MIKSKKTALKKLILIWIIFYPFVRIGLPLFTLFSIVTAFIIRKYVSDVYFSLSQINLILMMFFLTSSISNLRETLYKIPVILGTQSKQNYINSYRKKYSKIKGYSSFIYMNESLPVNEKVLLCSRILYE